MYSESGWRNIRLLDEDNKERFVMKTNMIRALGIMAAAVLVVAGCGKKSEQSTPEGAMERTGAALDTAAEKTAEAAKKAATATKSAAGVVVEKTGSALERAGSAMEGAGTDMQE